MKNIFIICGICLILVFCNFIPNTEGYKISSNEIIYVNDDGGFDYTKIQDAIDNASAGDTIFVFNGIYTELVKINKQIMLIGEDNSATILQSIQSEEYSPSFTLLTISADDVTVKNLCFRPYNNITRYRITGINAEESDNIIIQHNRMINCRRGILFVENTSAEILDNHIEFYGSGIASMALWFVNPTHGSELIISNNTLIRYGLGVFFNFYESAPNRIIVDHNDIHSPFGEHSSYSFDGGIQFSHTVDQNYYLQISHNTITGFNFGFYYNELFGGGPPLDNSSVQIFFNTFNNEDSDLYLLPNSVLSNEELVITKNNFFGENTREMFLEEVILDPFMIPFLLNLSMGLIHKSSIQWDSNYWQSHHTALPKLIPGKMFIFIKIPFIAIQFPIFQKDTSPVITPYDIQ